MLKSLITIFLLLPALCFSQASLTGKVLSKADKKPIAGATVFLSNATIGTITNEDGTFTLNNVKSGQYALVVSCIGFETYYQMVTANNTAIVLPVIEMLVKSTELREVKIHAPDPNRAQYLGMFTEAFLGNTPNAKACKILNPDVIDLEFNH